MEVFSNASMLNETILSIAQEDGEANATAAGVDSIFCEEDSHPQRRLIFMSIGTVIALIGIVCNSLLLYVFTVKARKTSSCNLITLAALDWLFCVFYIQMFSLDKASVYLEIYWLFDYVWQLKVAIYGLSKMVMMAIPYVLIASSAERFFRVYGRANATSAQYRLIPLALILFIVIILRIPSFFVIYVYDLNENDDAGCPYFNRLTTSATDEYMNSPTFQMFEQVVQFLHTFVSFVVLLVINVLTVVKSCKIHEKARRQSSCPALLLGVGVAKNRSAAEEEEKREHKRLRYTVRTTLVIISSYLICNFVHLVLYVIEQYNKALLTEEAYFSPTYEMWSDIGSALFVLSSATRLFIYYKYNPEVRSLLKALRLGVPECLRQLHDVNYIQKPSNGVSV